MMASLSDAEGDLTFSMLDDLALGISRRQVQPGAVLSKLTTSDIGPMVEVLLYCRTDGGPIPSIELLQPTRRLLALCDAVDGPCKGAPQYLSNEASGRIAGFIATAHRHGTQWDDFCQKAKAAANRAGLEDLQARALIAALVEIEENVHRHSGRPEDGLVGFAASPGRFELVVGDSGIGILESLRTSPDFADLTDDGSALEMALANGNSRYGRNSGCGLGFNQLFVGLASLLAELRFRSGDHALTIAGPSPKLVSATTMQRVPIKGFMASISCSPMQGSLLTETLR